MNIKNYFLLLMITASTIGLYSSEIVTTTECAINNTTAKPIEKRTARKGTAEWKAFCKAYCTSIVAGGVVGGVTGYLEQYVEKRFEASFPTTLLFMFVECIMRNEIIITIQKDFDTYFIKNSGKFMHLSSSVASWITYVA